MIDKVVIPPRSITQLVAEVQVGCGQEGLIEPLNNRASISCILGVHWLLVCSM